MDVSVRPLLALHDLASVTMHDRVHLGPRMSGIEEEPCNDWLHVALSELRRLKQDRGENIARAAFIGSANGVDVIAALRLFRIGSLVVTDIVPEIIPDIERNIRDNTVPEDLPEELCFVVGRDCEPVPWECDLIYANLPLVMASDQELQSDLATTTLTDSSAYLKLAYAEDDPLLKWSLLPQLGFLLSAKEKLAPGGCVITLIGGRIPEDAIAECFQRAGMAFERGTVAVMRQSDEEYVEQYALYEAQFTHEAFLFYDEAAAAGILRECGYAYPSIVDVSAEEMRLLLAPAALTAEQARQRVSDGHHVAHLSYGFRAVPKA
ncbi:hypothetical protein [Afifella pfennigii]|uniref:hypothetical protein n=1 Tax=Afifella pfennigii TaxID=209897 RepID=UPI00047973B7|nr:hypothetical protein [Afifella pfennigii]